MARPLPTLASGASNLGPNDGSLTQTVHDRRASAAAFDGVPAGQVPPDALTASGSGLDRTSRPPTPMSRSTGSPRHGVWILRRSTS